MKLEEQAKFGPISYRAAPAGMSAMSVKGYEAMPSRIPILMEIMNALKLADVKMVGVYGMGGIGKTTLVKEVAVEAMKNKLFDKMVIATVTQNQDIMKIQGQIADQLGLKFDEESEWGRASRLRDRLKQEKKILIVLDDLWKRLDLDAVGISFEDGQKECKMLLTSRESDVLSSGMDVQKNFPLRNLQEEEAWDLFKITAGGNVENPDVQSVAFEIAKKCAGLPVAIVTVAKALKDKGLPQWKDALRDLQKPSPRNFTGVPGEVYGAMELSYKHLESEELKSTFLLCSRMGYNASIEDLLKYGMGLGLFFGVATTEEARNKVYSLVHKLKNSCLLLDGNTSKQFSIHDVVRDVATSIAFRDHDVIVRSSNEVELEWPDKDSLKYTEIWLHGNSIGLSKDLKYPMLKVFNMHSEDPSLEIPGNIFGGMQKLEVLGLTNFSLPSLPSSLHLLENLCSLCLHQSSLGEIAIIGGLKNLEFLSFVKSTIKHLPREIGELTKLKLLDLSDCSELEVISPNVISSLSLLQELCLGNSFHRWDIGPNNASLVELKHLSRLTNLEIHVPDSPVMLKDLFSRKLERYRIFIGDVWDWDGVYETSRTLKLKLDERAYHSEQGILKLLKQTEDLYILEWKGVKNVICELDREGFPLLKHLQLHNSPEIQYIIDTMDGVLSNISLFPMLESLFLSNLVSLEKIYHGTLRTQSLGKLQSLEVENCNKLKKLFSFSMAQGLSQLQSIKITSCLNMEEVVAEESEEFDSRNEGTDAMEFTELRFISLQYLPRLRKFYSREKTSCVSQTQSKSLIAAAEFGESILNEELQPPMQLLDNKIVFPELEELDLCSINTDRLWNGQLPAVSIQNLQKLVVAQCENVKYIFSSSMVKSLVQLKYLTVSDCKSVEEIVVAEALTEEEMSKMLFPKLEEIGLWSLPKLKQFCTGSVIECPLLKRLTIDDCYGLETFISDFRSTNFTIGNEAPELNLEEKCSNATQPLFDEKVIFPRLAEIQILDLGNLENIWHYQLAAGSFCELRSIQIWSCHKLVNIFGEENQASDAFQLRDPHLISLPKLKQIWKEDPQAIHNFRNLRSIKVFHCDVLKNLFPFSIARDLPQLGKLQIERCGSLREIVAKVEDDEAAPRFEFPQLTSLSLAYLGEFRNFYPGKHTLVCPILTSLAVLGEGQHHKSTQQPLFFFEKAISNLEEVSLDGEGTSTTSIIRWHSKLGPDFDSKLKVLKLYNFEKKSDPIPFGFFQRLRNLETLSVTKSSFKRLFLNEGLVDEEHTWTLEQFKNLTIELDDDLRHLWEEDHRLVPLLQNLKTLNVMFCNSLVNLAPPSASFQNLSTLKVDLCTGLLNLITSSTAKSLVQLVKLTINYCANVTEIVAKQEEETEDEITFSKLEYLELVRLESLTSFCSGNYIFKFPSLKEMVVENCPKMRIFSPGAVSTPKLAGVRWQRYPKNKRCWQGNLNSTILQLYTDMVRFNGLGNLKLSSFPQLKEAWDGQLPVNLYSHLSDITVDDCPSFSISIPSNVLQFMHNVESLTVTNCDSLEGVFDLEGLNAEEGHARLLPKLRKLNLLSLPRLKHIWNKDPEGILDFKNLEVLKVHNCSSLRNIFTPSMALGLVQLREIEISNCAMVEEIIVKERAEQASIERFIFPLLKVIILESLPNLTSIYSGSGILEIPALEELTIDSDRHMNAFVSSILREKDPSLINEGKVQRPGKGEHAISSALLLNHKAISDLEELSLGGQGTSTTSSIRWHCKLGPNIDSRLKVLKLHNFKKKSDPIPFVFFQRLCNLETLFVRSCSFKRLFLNEGLIDEEHTWTPEQLANLEIVSIHDVRHLWEEDHQLVPLLQNLKTLQVKSCSSLVNLAPSSASFQNLSTLKVDFCTGLLNLITSSTAKSLVQLVKLTINYCDNVTEIVAKQEEETEDEITFSKLEYLELVGLDSLTSFCSGNYIFKFPSLKEIVVERCPQMRSFSPGALSTPKLQRVCCLRYSKNKRRWQGDLNSTIQQMYTEMVGFNGLWDLKLSRFPQLKEKWCGQLPVTFYNPLSYITVDDCSSLSIAIPSNVLQFMDDLKHLTVRNCDSLEGVFDLEGLNAKEGHARLLPKLRKLNLIDLPRLKHIWSKDPEGILDFKNLEVLKVHNCSSLRNIFTPSMALGLVQLRKIEISNCAMVEEIITEERAKQASVDRFLFPLLKVIVLESLPNLTSIYSESRILEIPSIEEITIDGCPHMKTFVSSILREKDQSPTNEGKVQRPGKGEHDISTAPLLNHKVAFPNLKKLSVEWNDILEVIRHDQFREEFFCKLKVLELVHFPNDYVDFHFLCHFLQKFTNLEKIVIKDASFEEIVLREETNSGKKYMGVLAQLKELKLSRLLKLVHLSNEDSLLCPVFQNLEKLDVFECGRLKMLVHSSMSFQCLTELKVSKCHGLINLMTSSTAKRFMQLTWMSIIECDLVEEIVVNKEREAETEVVFPKLKYLTLCCLPNLTSFHLENCPFMFPSLEVVIVKECPKMEIFSQGVISTPELERVITERDLTGYFWEDDLNSTIQKLFVETGNGVAQSKLPSSSKQPISACDAGQANKDGLSVVSGGQASEVLLITETPDTIKDLPPIVEMIHGTNKHISKGVLNDKDQSSPISISSETQICLQVQKVPQSGPPQDKVMPASSIQKSGYVSHAAVGEPVPISTSTASLTDSMPASKTSSVDLIKEKSYSPADFKFCTTKNLSSDFDATDIRITEEKATRSAVMEHEKSQLAITYQDSHKASNDKEDPTGCQNSPMNIDSRTHISLHFEKDTQGIAEDGEPSQEQAMPGSSIQQSNPIPSAITARKNLPHDSHNASKDKEDPTQRRNSSTNMDIRTHVSLQFEKDTQGIAEEGEPSQEQATPCSSIQQSNPISPPITARRDLPHDSHNASKDKEDPTQHRNFPTAMETITHISQQFKKDSQAIAKSEPSQEQVRSDSSIQQSNPISPAIAVEGDATSTLAFPAKISSHSPANFESLFARVEQLLNPSPSSSSQSASNSNTQPESHKSNGMSLETYGYSMALIKKILTKPLEEVARSYDRLSLLSALRNLKNCHLQNSQQSEIIQIYVENFDSLVTYHPFYEQEIDRTSALKSSIKDWEKEITELKNLYEDLASKIVNLIAFKEELKKKLRAIEEEDHIQEKMEILYAQLVSGKEKLETGIYALPESERQRKEAEDRANNANDYWAKIKSLFAKSEPSQEQVTPDSPIQQSNPISPVIAVEGDATSTLAFPAKISSHFPSKFESLFASVGQLLNPSPASSSQSASISNTQPESHRSNSMNLETYGYSIALIKKILTKSLEEVARSYDRLSLLSALRNLKNCPFLNSQQSEIIQIYVENFDSLVTYYPFYDQEIDRTSALKSSVKDWEKEITELKNLYEDLSSKIVNRIAAREELKKKLCEIQEEEDHIQEQMEILYAQLVSGKEKLETGMYALPESERQQREAEDRANNANDYWAKIRSLFA